MPTRSLSSQHVLYRLVPSIKIPHDTTDLDIGITSTRGKRHNKHAAQEEQSKAERVSTLYSSIGFRRLTKKMTLLTKCRSFMSGGETVEPQELLIHLRMFLFMATYIYEMSLTEGRKWSL